MTIHTNKSESAMESASSDSAGENETTDENNQIAIRKNSLALSSPDEETNKTLDNKYGHLLPPLKTSLKFLLIFSNFDPTGDALKRAAEKVGFEVTCTAVDTAVEEFQHKHHDLIVIDCRSSKTLDYETMCRALRHVKSCQNVPIVAVVKRSLFERDDNSVINLLECGFNRCILESTSVFNYVNEIIQLKLSDIKPMSIRATNQALYAALDKCNNLVFITDDNYKCQYVNVILEKYLQMKPDEVIGRSFPEQILYDSSQLHPVNSSLLRAREWSGTLTLKKKSQDPIISTCKAIPIVCSGRLPTHFVLVLEVTVEPSINILAQARGSIHSIRRGSNEARMGSDYLRRTSIAKLAALPLEAPITKIISLIDQAREMSTGNTQIVQLMDKVEDTLRCSELYASQVREDFRIQPEEPVICDLITALLSKQPQPVLAPTSRRSSNDSAIYKPPRGSLLKLSVAVNDLLENALFWEFEIFLLEELTKRRPLQYLGMHLFTHFEVANSLNCDEKVLNNWLMIIEAHYHIDNVYHNSTHAADVMQATGGFLQKDRIKSIMEPLDEAFCLIAAAAHDVDHPGKSSAFLTNSDNSLSILYNDITVLESHHAACMFKLTLGDDRVNIFKNLDRDTYKIARHNIIDMILATEMTKHFEHLAKFVNVFCTKNVADDDDEEMDQDYITISLPENITLIKRMLIKCSDVSNPTRPMRLYMEWARRIAEEYFQQTDEEKVKGLPVVMPMFDRNTCSVPKSQIGFVDYIINDMFEAWNAFIEMPELINYMRQNYMRWKEFDEQGHTTLADIRVLQNTVLMAPIFPGKPSKKD